MTYLAIARKYRPATFDEIVGQEHVTRTLRNAIKGDRIHHAYLFTGARGVGKTTAARALARALNCEEGPTDTPCGVCTSCKEVASGTSPDLIEIDGASNNSVEDVREIREAVQYAPTRGRFKIYLVDEVHMLSKAAFNALLKTLEEPPPHIVFVFATTEPNKIPDTILSRVQRFDFKRIPVPKVVDHLGTIAEKEGVSLSSKALRLIARAGEGSMRDAQSVLDRVISAGGGETDIADTVVTETLGLVDRALLHDFLHGLVHGEPATCLAIIDKVYGWGHELSVFTEELLEVMRDATFLGLSAEARRFVDLAEDEIETLVKTVEGTSPERLARLFDALVEVHDQVKHAGRPRIVLEMAVARLATTREAQPVGALLGRLETLERNLRGGGGGGGGGRGGARGGPPGRRPPRRGAGPDRGPRGAPAPTGRPPERSPRASRRPDDPRASVAAPTPPPRAQQDQAPPAPRAPQPHPTEVPEPPPRDQEEFSGGEGGGWDTLPVQGGTLGALPLDRKPSAKVKRRLSNRGRTRTAPPKPETPWDRFCAAVRTAGPRFEVFTRASHLEEGQRLRLILPSGRPLAEATRLKDHPAVVQALAASYAPGTVLVLEASRSSRVDSATLEREFLSDPALRKIVQTLGATVERVEPDPETPAPDAGDTDNPGSE